MRRLEELVQRREQWREELSSVRQMHERVVMAERILDGATLRAAGVEVSNAKVGQAFDRWCQELAEQLNDEKLPKQEADCLKHFLHVTTNMRPHLICCYDLAGLPRTNNDMEGFIRSLKTRYRRISGRKNWNRYLLRYGRSVAYYEALVRMEDGLSSLELRVRQIPAAKWRASRAEQRACQEQQLKQYRFRHKRAQFLERLEARWAEAVPCTPLLP